MTVRGVVRSPRSFRMGIPDRRSSSRRCRGVITTEVDPELRVACLEDFLGGSWFVWRVHDRAVIHSSTVKGCLRWRHTWGRSLGNRTSFTRLPDDVLLEPTTSEEAAPATVPDLFTAARNATVVTPYSCSNRAHER